MSLPRLRDPGHAASWTARDSILKSEDWLKASTGMETRSSYATWKDGTDVE